MYEIIPKALKKDLIGLWIIALVLIIISQVIPFIDVNYSTIISLSLLTIGVSIFFTSISVVHLFPKYKGSYNFMMGTIVGFTLSLGLAEILLYQYSGELWAYVIIIGWISGGYLGIKDQVGKEDDILNSPFAAGLAIGGIFFATLVGLLILSFIVAFIFSIFSISIENLYIVVISYIIIHATLVNYLGKKVFSDGMNKIDYKPNIKGIFGSFVGLIIGLIISSIVGYVHILLVDLSVNTFFIGIYVGLLAGIIVGFFIAYKIEKDKLAS